MIQGDGNKGCSRRQPRRFWYEFCPPQAEPPRFWRCTGQKWLQEAQIGRGSACSCLWLRNLGVGSDAGRDAVRVVLLPLNPLAKVLTAGEVLALVTPMVWQWVPLTVNTQADAVFAEERPPANEVRLFEQANQPPGLRAPNSSALQLLPHEAEVVDLVIEHCRPLPVPLANDGGGGNIWEKQLQG